MVWPSHAYVTICGGPDLRFLLALGDNRDMDISLDPCCGRVTDPDMALGSSPGPEETMSLGSNQASHISLFFTAFSLDQLVSIGHELSLPFPPIPHHTFAHCMVQTARGKHAHLHRQLFSL